jgi:AcrR family transcriptional regulator
MMDAALRLASTGGLDALQMRRVAAEAQVSSRTLYRYFPTKNYLLVAALFERAGGVQQFLRHAHPTGRTPVQRVVSLLRVPTETLQASSRLTSAMVTAVVSGEPAMGPLLRAFTDAMTDAVVVAIRNRPTPDDRQAATALEQVWFAALVGWVSGAHPPGYVLDSVTAAAKQLFS